MNQFREAKATFVAGTFCHHPLAMATSLKNIRNTLNSTKGELLD